MHKLLQRQLKRCIGGPAPSPEEWLAFLAAVNEAYEQSDADRTLLERSLELSSQELTQINESLRSDILQRKTIEENLKSSFSILRATLEATQDGIAVTDLKGHILDHNRRFVEIWGIPDAVLASGDVERTINAVIEKLKDPDVFLKKIKELFIHPDEDSFDVLEFTDGRVIERYSKPQEVDGKSAGRVWSFRDVTEKKRMEQKTLIAGKMGAIGQLAAGVAHEINNPLGVIYGFAQSLVRRLQPNDPMEVPLRAIEREAIRCTNLVQDLLTFSRASRSEREPTDLNKSIEACLSLLQAQARVKKCTIQTRFGDTLPRILANINQLQQVVINLANNAFDAMPQGGDLVIETFIQTADGLPWICLKISDTGEGIPPEVLPRIFEPFFTTKPIGKGTGLGLSLIYEIVAKHSGTIDVHSRPGCTEFLMKFPARTGQEVSERLQNAQQSISQGSL
jgi:two-component system, cell cycle sensor histidine kinase and response regulator CckA